MKYIKQNLADYPLSPSSRRRLPYRIIAISRQEIRCLVENDDLMGAVELLLELVDFCDQSKSNHASLLKRRITAIERGEHVNVLEYEKICTERNRLGLAILELTEH